MSRESRNNSCALRHQFRIYSMGAANQHQSIVPAVYEELPARAREEMSPKAYGAIASLDVLHEIATAVGDEITALFDSGIRRGADVFKAMALGAKAVMVARPYALSLALGGAKGIWAWTGKLISDTELPLGLAGCTSWGEVSNKNLRRMA